MAAGRHDQILEVARDAFARDGFAVTSLDAVAEVIGTTRPAIYYHFRSKEELLELLVERYIDRIDEALDTGAQGHELLDALASVWFHDPVLTAWVDREPAVRSHSTLSARLDAQAERFRSLLVGDGTQDQAAAAAVVGALRRPILALELTDIVEHRTVVVRAAHQLLNTLRVDSVQSERAPGQDTSVARQL